TLAGRLARVYFGAVNPARATHPDGEKVTHIVPGDDVTLAEYAPHRGGGPIHLINCAVSETVDPAAGLRRARAGATPLTAGPVALTVGERAHASWADGALAPLAAPPGAQPFPGGREPEPIGSLDLRTLVAASGGGTDPPPDAPRAVLRTLANDRPA